MHKIRIATRGSKLALWQAKFIAQKLEEKHPGLQTELIVIKTKGDKILDVPLAQVGGKGLFVKEIEEALLADQADIAVHSMKDVPAVLPKGLKIGIFPEREDRIDLLLSETYADLKSLPKGAKVGTSSLRRRAQLLALRPDLQILPLRGNLDTRVNKLKQGEYAAIVVAKAGMKRLGLRTRYQFDLAPPLFVPAVAQGALGIEYKEKHQDVEQALSFLDHLPTRWQVLAERGFLDRLEGGCQVPLGAYAQIEQEQIIVHGFLADPEGKTMFKAKAQGPLTQAKEVGVDLAEKILAQGGSKILARLYAP